jgi:hypothetical protein
MAKLKMALAELEWVVHKILVAVLAPSVAHSIEHYYYSCHFLKNLLLLLGQGIPVLPWRECHSMLDSMGTQRKDQGRMVWDEWK